jgi:hypothetical protein
LYWGSMLIARSKHWARRPNLRAPRSPFSRSSALRSGSSRRS